VKNSLLFFATENSVESVKEKEQATLEAENAKKAETQAASISEIKALVKGLS